MKAIIYTRYGSPDVLRVAEAPRPVPKSHEVLIRVCAAEATKADCEMRSFNFPVKWFWLPLRIALGLRRPRRQILGGYFSGEIESIGGDVSTFKKADLVFGSAGFRMGAYGEYLCLSDDSTIVEKPSNQTFEEAAAVPLGALNALHYLTRAKIKDGETVLINGAGGSIGTFSVQIAKSMGAEVTAVDIGIKEEMLRQIGADHFVDYTKESYTENGRTYDVIFDMVASSSYARSVLALSPNGRYLMANPSFVNMLRSSITTRFTGKTVLFAFAGERTEELVLLKEMIERGQIVSTVDRVYPMNQAGEAHRRVETEQRLGCVVLSIGGSA